ncbi:MAG: cell division protein FtsL [Candidatus Aminicenantes bacterium]|nr:cell division protein FtsL [Candidatus Aminicenantes bacterium]
MIQKKFSKKEVVLGISLAVIVIFVLSFYIWHQVESIRLGYDARKLERKIQQLSKDIEKLETVKSSLLSLEKVERIAIQDLHMQPADQSRIFFFDFEAEVSEKR